MLALLPLLAACGPAAPDSAADPLTPGTFRVAFIADTHVIGPQYVCCSESDGIDNASIMKTPDRLAEVVRRLNAVDPAPDHVFVLGDVMHDNHPFHALEDYDTEETAWSRAAALLGELEMPYHLVWGNHDYEVDCGTAGEDPRQFTHALFERFFGATPTGVVDHRGWRFVLTNSQLGPTWGATDERCATGTGSFGAEQLAWVDAQLAEGLPSVVMSHHYLPVTRGGEDPDGLGDLEAVLAAHPNLRLSLAGHAHRWIDFTPTYGFPHLLLGATRYDTDDFWIVEFDADGDTYTILDYDKARWLTTCADTWTYDGTPAPDAGAPEEDGDCGS